MSSEAAKSVNKAIREILAPLLRADGFQGSGRRYYRVHGEVVHLFKVQGSMSSPKFAVNLGIHLRFLGAMGGRPVDPTRLHESECFLRTRMAEDRQSGEQWWEHDGTADSITSGVTAISRVYTHVGRDMFDRFSRYPESFAHLTLGKIRGGLHGFGITTWADLARIRLYEGDTAGVIAFVEQELKDTRPGDPKRAHLEALRAEALQQSGG